MDRTVEESNGKTRVHKGRMLTPKKSGKYYGISLFDKPLSQRFYIHRLVAEAFIPNPENKPCVNHKNRDKFDNRVENLEWVTYQENSLHLVRSESYVKLPTTKGEFHHCSKLTEIDVKQIRKEWLPGDSGVAVAKAYGITPAAVYKILDGRSWKHVDPPRAVNRPRKESN